jgi:predicted nucleic acid-binding protein
VSGYSFDANIIIDALGGYRPALDELRRENRERHWISRMVWIEVLSKGSDDMVTDALDFLAAFDIDEVDENIAERAARLRRARPRLKSPDAIILASAQERGRILVTRNIRDFPANMPGIRVPYTINERIV